MPWARSTQMASGRSLKRSRSENDTGDENTDIDSFDDTDSSARSDDEPPSDSDGTSSGEETMRCIDESRKKFELKFGQVFREEQASLEERQTWRQHQPGGGSGVSFSVAFSGGGVRAAAFQAGVLWRLALSGKLKDVEYLCAVSGGGYIASAFISHCVEAEALGPRDSLSSWYLDRAAETICRMQANIGYLVRDPSPSSDAPAKALEGSGWLPRIFDLPILVLMLVVTLSTFPCVYSMMYLVPFTEIADLFFGSAARTAFCALGFSPWKVFFKSYHMMALIIVTGCLILLNFVIFVLWKLLPPCQLRKPKPRGRPPRNLGWLFGQSALAALSRMCVIILLVVFAVMTLTDMEIWEWEVDSTKRPQRMKVCNAFIDSRRESGIHSCSDLEDGIPWWNLEFFNETEAAFAEGKTKGFVREALNWLRTSLSKSGYTTSMWSFTCGTVLFVLVLALILLPFTASLLLWVLFLVGPIMLFMGSVGFVRWRIFSPITRQGMPPWTTAAFDDHAWQHVVLATFICDICLMPFFPCLRSTMHRYYARSLRQAYFARGEDKQWSQVKENLLCPFLLLTGTVNDYVRADDARAIHEISFSFLHTGSDTLGYVRCGTQSLAKCTALGGAATDAFILGMLDKLQYRFWLEVLNLAMGDFIPFRRGERWEVKLMHKRLGCTVLMASRLVHQLPSSLLIALFYCLLLAAISLNQNAPAKCDMMRIMTRAAMVIGAMSFVLSFFGFLPCFKFLLHQPGIRQLHQAMRYYHRAARPPNLIYVTDGGVQDCTGITQLIRRRRPRILLALAAADATDELAVLRTTLEAIAKEKLASFYDPEDPRRDVRVVLDEFQEDEAKTYLHLGIHYGWNGEAQRETGHLVIVKNRLPPSMRAETVRPLLTEDDIRDGGVLSRNESCGGMLQTDLAACCCDCCHTRCCILGSKFPHVSNANQCMTPQMFNSLCRLGFALSHEAVELISAAEPLAQPWETHVPSTTQSLRRPPPQHAPM